MFVQATFHIHSLHVFLRGFRIPQLKYKLHSAPFSLNDPQIMCFSIILRRGVLLLY